MDPLSITTGALSLVTKSIIAVQACQSYATKYKLADLSIAAIRTECASIRIALVQIQNLIPPDDGKNVRRQFEAYVLEEYEAVLSACSLTFSLLNERLDSLGLNGLNERNESDLGSKLRLLWKETTMETIRQNIRGQAIAITLLLTAFQSETTAKTYQIIRSQEVKDSLKSVSDDARSLRDSISIANARQSDLSTTRSVIGDEEFGFDDLVINSTAYRRVFMKEQNKLELQMVQEANEDDTRNYPSEPQTSHSCASHVGFGEESVVEQMQNKPRLLDRALGIFVRNRTPALPKTLTASQVPQQLESLPNTHFMELPQNWELANQMSASSATPEPRSQHPLVDSATEDLVAKAIEYHEAGALAESTYCFRHAAVQNHPDGMLIYALACQRGWGMRPNQREGVVWLRKAAEYASLEISGGKDLTVDNLEQKTRRAQFALCIYETGITLMNGWGIEQDKALALRCFEIAGSWGDGDALAEAGFCYAQGIGCKKDLKKSAKFYRQAEAKGIHMVGNSWIYKAKFNDDADDSKKTSVLKQR